MKRNDIRRELRLALPDARSAIFIPLLEPQL